MINIAKLNERLAALDLTPNAASQMAGLGRDYVRDILRGRIKEPSALRLRRLADTLGCHPSELLEEEADARPGARHVDDRDINLPRAMARFRREKKIVERVSSYSDLLDSVSPKTLCEMTYTSIGLFLYDNIGMDRPAEPEDLEFLLGSRTRFDQENFKRRVLTAKLLEEINPQQAAKALAIQNFWRASRNLGDEEIFAASPRMELLSPLFPNDLAPEHRSGEKARLALIGAVLEYFVAATERGLVKTERDD